MESARAVFRASPMHAFHARALRLEAIPLKIELTCMVMLAMGTSEAAATIWFGSVSEDDREE